MGTVDVPPRRGIATLASRRTDVQGLRGLAVVLVVVFHIREWIPGGFVGVDVFFVISGFVITSMLRSQASSGTFSVGQFFARRVRRLLPLLAVTLTLTSLGALLLLSPLGPASVTAKTGVAAALLNANTFLARQAQDYFALPADANALLHTWSLSVEEQFYLVVPVLVIVVLAAARRRLVSRRVVPVLMVIGLVLSFVAFTSLARGAGSGLVEQLGFSSSGAVAFYSAPTRAWEFLFGALAAVGAPRAAGWSGRLRASSGAVGLVAVLGSALLLSGDDGLSGPLMAIPVLGTVAMLLAGVGGEHPVGSLLAHRVPVALGDVSYGWYLFHWPLIVFVEANTTSVVAVVAAALAALGLAFAARGPIEDRFRHDTSLRGRRLGGLVAACVAVPVLIGLVVVAADDAWRIDELEDTRAVHVDSAECNARLVDGVDVGSPACTWEAEQSRGRIVLIGDSHASMWSEPLIAAGNDLGYDVSIATMSGCPPLTGITRREGEAPDEECRRFVDSTLDRIEQLGPTLVVLGSGSIGATSPDSDADFKADGGAWSTGPESAAQVWEAGLRRTTAQLQRAGIPTMILHDVPYHEVTTATCGRLLFLLRPAGCASERRLDQIDRERTLSQEVEDRVEAESTDVVTVDPVPWLCRDRTCSTYLDGVWMYRDGDHLSVAGATSLTGRMRDALAQAGW
jgi:peptidoglycan/LPS O-acetylase OafA/YrhL